MKLYCAPDMKLMLDYSDIGIDEELTAKMSARLKGALEHMKALEAGAVANPSEGRMVGHYWLRAPELAPNPEITKQIRDCEEAVDAFVKRVHRGDFGPMSTVLICGIGGSALGIQFISGALYTLNDKMRLRFIDNTDPQGMDRIFDKLKDKLNETLVIVISKSGGTVETRNGMLETQEFYRKNGVDFASHAVCISQEGSKLWKTAEAEGWLAEFPMWDWVGGRTSVTSAVGLLPLALQGIDINALLTGAAECDVWGRSEEIMNNPAAIMALAWYGRTGGKGGTTNVILPYRDGLSMLPRYLQQLIMESLGKEFDLDGKRVKQGLAVMGNKGSTDQHSYIQQLVAGPDNVFVTFVQALTDRDSLGIDVLHENDPAMQLPAYEHVTTGDFLNASILGNRKSLKAHGKATMTLTVPDISAESIGRLIALFERTVGIYAKLININAYDQPAVEAGKKAANALIALQQNILMVLGNEEAMPGEAAEAFSESAAGSRKKPSGDRSLSCSELARRLGADPEDVFHLLIHLAGTGRVSMETAEPITESRFSLT